MICSQERTICVRFINRKYRQILSHEAEYDQKCGDESKTESVGGLVGSTYAFSNSICDDGFWSTFD